MNRQTWSDWALIAVAVAVLLGVVLWWADGCSTWSQKRRDARRELEAAQKVLEAQKDKESALEERVRADLAAARDKELGVVIEGSEVLIVGSAEKVRAISDPDRLVDGYRNAGFRSARLRRRAVPESSGRETRP